MEEVSLLLTVLQNKVLAPSLLRGLELLSSGVILLMLPIYLKE